MISKTFLRRVCASLALAVLAPLCQAQSAPPASRYPDKPLRLVLAFPPGGPTDLVARVLAQKLGEQLGQSVLVDNRPGANGNIAAEMVARAPADGYTLFYNTSAVALSPALYKKLSYDVRTDFAPVALTAVIPLVLVVHPSLPVNTPAEFVAYARAQGDRLTFGSAGNGNITHLGAFLLLKGQGLQATHAPYKGSAPALTDLVGGQLQFMTDTVNSALPFIRDKRLRALAVTSLKRTSVLPEVPTLSETVAPGFEAGAWQGLLLPARTPPEIVSRLNAELLKALASHDVRAKLAQQGAEPLGSTPAEYGAYIDSEIRRWTEVVRQTGATLD
ncbi:MAG: tripartite tricarboxylate transporter substrate binding protein [Curvibacter sp.]|nr:MAG: tripartite tricarboxylate transporter substrate binding protein [Curvibacter sp.]